MAAHLVKEPQPEATAAKCNSQADMEGNSQAVTEDNSQEATEASRRAATAAPCNKAAAMEPHPEARVAMETAPLTLVALATRFYTYQ